MSSGYFNQFGVDLDGWFGPLGGGISTHKVGYQVAGQDLNLRYWPLSLGGIQVPPTGFYWHGQDLNTIFGWPPITAVGLEVHLVQVQTLDGGIVVSYDQLGNVTTNKYYATSGLGFIYGDPIPVGAAVQPSLPQMIRLAPAPSMPKSQAATTGLSFRIKNPDGTYQTLLQKYPTATITVTASTPGAGLSVIGDGGNAYTLALAGVTPTETNSSVSFKVEIPPAIPGNPSTLLYFGTVQVKPPKGIAQLFYPTNAQPTLGPPVLTATGGYATIAGGLSVTDSVTWVTDTNVFDVAINATFSARTSNPPLYPQPAQLIYYGLSIVWGVDPTNLFSEETVTVVRTDSVLSPVYNWTNSGVSPYDIHAYSNGTFASPSGSAPYTWVPGTTTDDITTDGLPTPFADPSLFLLNQVIVCQSKLAADADKLDILGDYYIVDTSAMDKFAFSDSGTLQYTGP